MDLIERQAAIEALFDWEMTYDWDDHCREEDPKPEYIVSPSDVIEHLPSAQPETHEKRTKTHSCDCISRQAAIDAHYEYCNKHPDAGFPVWSLKILEDLPSAQPELLDEWCTDCKEYDHEKHCCPRWNRVIRQTLKDAQPEPKWIPCSERLPEERQEILATTTDNAWGDVVIIRTYYKEMHKSVIAWMPLPEPYREGD